MHYTHFSRTERHELSILRKKGYSLRVIAAELGKSPSSVSRELRRNAVGGEYTATKAQLKAYVKRKQSKYQGMKVRERPELEAFVKEKLSCGWSPDRIAGRWNRRNPSVHVSPKAIYKWVYSVFGTKHIRFLVSGRERPQRRDIKKLPREIIKNRVCTEDRPHVIASRRRYGDFEADTMGRPKSASPETLVVVRERKSRFLLAKKVSRLRNTMDDGFKPLLHGLPVRSVTFDNGVENTRHEELGVPTYFCHPYSSWEKGGVENGISVIRRSIPKKADLAIYSQDTITAIIDRINDTPMKCLSYQTPREVFTRRYLNVHNRASVTVEG
jgi:IS30 family transposase